MVEASILKGLGVSEQQLAMTVSIPGLREGQDLPSLTTSFVDEEVRVSRSETGEVAVWLRIS